MALFIKGDEIHALVDQYCAMTGLTNKSEAVRQALAAQISALSTKETLSDRVAKLRDRAVAEGFAPGIAGDDKAFMDDMWGEP